MSTPFSFNDIAAVQAKIDAAEQKRNTAEDDLRNAIREGKPTSAHEKLLESATADLTRLAHEKSDLMKHVPGICIIMLKFQRFQK